jgi:hypothetical protein
LIALGAGSLYAPGERFLVKPFEAFSAFKLPIVSFIPLILALFPLFFPVGLAGRLFEGFFIRFFFGLVFALLAFIFRFRRLGFDFSPGRQRGALSHLPPGSLLRGRFAALRSVFNRGRRFFRRTVGLDLPPYESIGCMLQESVATLAGEDPGAPDLFIGIPLPAIRASEKVFAGFGFFNLRSFDFGLFPVFKILQRYEGNFAGRTGRF